MTHDEIEVLVKREFASKLPEWEVKVVSADVRSFFGDKVIVVDSRNVEDQEDSQDICILHEDERRVTVFHSSHELARYIESRSLTPLWDRVFTTKILSGAVFSGLLVCIFIAGFFKDKFDPQALSILASVVGVAAGFYFGASRSSQ